MKDCLFLKLDGALSNPNVEQLGALTLRTHKLTNPNNPYGYRLTLQNKADITVKVDGDGYFALSMLDLTNQQNLLTEYVVSANTTGVHLFFKNDDYKIIITSKYDITYIATSANSDYESIIVVNTDDIEYLTSLKSLTSGASTVGRLNILPQSSEFAQYRINGREGTTFGGDISLLNANPVFTEIKMTSCKNVYGSIESLTDLTGLTSLTFTDCLNVIGAIENLASGQVSKGRTSGQLVCKLQGTNCTYNDEAIAVATLTITFDSSVTSGYTIS